MEGGGGFRVGATVGDYVTRRGQRMKSSGGLGLWGAGSRCQDIAGTVVVTDDGRRLEYYRVE